MEMPAVIERYLQSLKTGEGVAELPEPSCRAEEYLMYCIKGGNIDDLPEPVSRLDILLHNLAINGGVGGGEDCNHEWATEEEIRNAIEEIFKFSGDGIVTEEDLATDKEVDDVIDDVFDMDVEYIATDKDVNAAIASVFQNGFTEQ